jgi:cytochrome c-type biogenesis protein CcsB
MPPDTTLAALSDNLMTATIAIYALALHGYAAAFATRRTPATAAPVPARVLAGAGGPDVTEPPQEAPEAPGSGEPATAATAERVSLLTSPAGQALGRYAVVLTVAGWVAHLGQITARGLAAHRLPWGNMDEFVTALTFAAVTGLLILIHRQKVRYLGLFVMIPVVLGLGMATTVLYAPVGALRPSLHSYWIAIHVTAAIIACGAFTLATAANVLYLLRDRHERGRITTLAAKLPDARALERLAQQTVMFAFPIWTFAIIAGAIWADQAWGRYWGWDPKESWAFITWIVYAAHLHARSTLGWRGRKAAAIAVLGYGCLLFNLIGVNIFFSGLHSYAGV